VAKKKKLVKAAIENSKLYTEAEICYFHLWLKHQKEKKAAKKAANFSSCADAHD
jgi:hypothetical protein